MATNTSLDARAGEAFIEALRRAMGMVFFEEELIISEKMKIGASIVCKIEAHKKNGNSSEAIGKAYVYQDIDLIVVCIESMCKRLQKPIFHYHYEYFGY